jgi:hypothetical protein
MNKIYMGENGQLVDGDHIMAEYERIDSTGDTFAMRPGEYLHSVTGCGGYYTECSVIERDCCDIVAMLNPDMVGNVSDLVAGIDGLWIVELHDMKFISNDDNYELIKVIDPENIFTNY